MSQPIIPEDLKASYCDMNEYDKKGKMLTIHPTVIKGLYERIGRVEHERDELSLERDRANGKRRCLRDRLSAEIKKRRETEAQLAEMKLEEDPRNWQVPPSEIDFKYIQPKEESGGN